MNPRKTLLLALTIAAITTPAAAATSRPGGAAIPLITEHSAGQNGPAGTGVSSNSGTLSPATGGFDWRDAGVGAAVGAGVVLLAGGASVRIRRSGTAARAA